MCLQLFQYNVPCSELWLGIDDLRLFATAEYALKNPIVDRLGESLSDPMIQSVWVVQTVVLSALFQQLRLGD